MRKDGLTLEDFEDEENFLTDFYLCYCDGCDLNSGLVEERFPCGHYFCPFCDECLDRCDVLVDANFPCGCDAYCRLESLPIRVIKKKRVFPLFSN